MSQAHPLNILAISGSLKSTSSNTNILRALSKFKTENIEFIVFDGLDQLSHFNPENEKGTDAVANFKEQLKKADGVIISTPEYAFGVPGTLKNALDWTVSSGELNEKPVIAISASPLYEGGKKAMTSLLLTLGALGTKMNEKSHLSIPNISKKINASAEILDPQLKEDLAKIFNHLVEEIQKSKTDVIF
ncbi:NADPH-dependent FMN reductase [Aurantibacillus circumpalustris]|uniref:NADPH-dependent FMN reductase n=1 Tax=Aurantibacillus circumpalustris TaxID=3036359 RepID=UPI00295A936B|nr:NAD(P)H-dependent oxidoreductase [Aurantibacillus circumpalustris]